MVLYRSEKSEKFCDLNKLVKKIIYTLKTAADLRDVSIKSKINKTGEISFNLDQTLFEVALRNLIDVLKVFSKRKWDFNWNKIGWK